MTIRFDMQNNSNRSSFGSDHQLKFQTGEGFTCIMVSGIVRVGFRGEQGGWRKDDFFIRVRIPAHPSGKILRLRSWVPLVTESSFQNENHSVNSGHAVTRFGLNITDERTISAPYIDFIGEVGVRDIDETINSLAYHATLLGEYIDREENPNDGELI